MYPLTWIVIGMQNKARKMQTSQFKHATEMHKCSRLAKAEANDFFG